MHQVDNYYTDHRVIAGESSKWYESFDPKRMTATMVSECAACPHEKDCSPEHCPVDDCDGVYTEEVTVKYEVCPTCEGKGKHVNPSIDCNGISAEEFAEDPDFAEDYFRGVYDVPCAECGGRRVVPVPVDDAVLARYHKILDEEAAYQAMCAAERRMGA